ncbi:MULTISPECIES: hypothetical protein [Clavibacter]|uniref:Membrane protein n=2 Tax=Clavibacter sepedonicus TaxID=31964 RepID=B0RJ84_CLASE|nr:MULTISPECIES: hypothetical protein [Clavibacter]MBD5382573.1 hypothetical protein [Clavibacter sp.]OQJ45223.1 hypothetical protein B5P19_15260 [Clavibacter sepedonicus]OQJ50858.1 hypothetical protein B5P20_15595 [Clavibacter sepedonicus]UUK67343.1 hypothetical protein LRE50_16420 [Clavibacter sepedonicus]CAQ03274.1 putative membrane protein [Clavibacter sepedonicus]
MVAFAVIVAALAVAGAVWNARRVGPNRLQRAEYLINLLGLAGVLEACTLGLLVPQAGEPALAVIVPAWLIAFLVWKAVQVRERREYERANSYLGVPKPPEPMSFEGVVFRAVGMGMVLAFFIMPIALAYLVLISPAGITSEAVQAAMWWSVVPGLALGALLAIARKFTRVAKHREYLRLINGLQSNLELAVRDAEQRGYQDGLAAARGSDPNPDARS